MKKLIHTIIAPLAAISLLASCLGSDYSTSSGYADAAITSFTLGTVNRYLTTLSSEGEDSTYKTTVTGSNYVFYIDQQAQEIYNPDSLPVGCRVSAVLCTVTSKNSGTIIIKNVDSDTLTYYSSSDSVDFSEPREFRVYAVDGESYRKYTVRVNVHEEYADSFQWEEPTLYSTFAEAESLRAVELNGTMLVYAAVNGGLTVYSTPISGTPTWTATAVSGLTTAADCEDLMLWNDALWTMSNGSLLRSDDGLEWYASSIATPDDTPLAHLLGADSQHLFCLTANGSITSYDLTAGTWSIETVIGTASQLPTESLAFGCWTAVTNADMERVAIVGCRSLDAYPEDSVAMVWNKVEEHADESESHSWFQVNENNDYQLPRLAGLQVVQYGDALVALGGAGIGTSTAEAFAQLYTSEDRGLTWLDSPSYPLPDDFAVGDAFALATDSSNRLWIISGSGQVWRGKLNKLCWEENQTVFVE